MFYQCEFLYNINMLTSGRFSAKKTSVVLVIFLMVDFLAACNGEVPAVVVTMHPSAVPIVLTMTEIAKTVVVLEASATAYASTATPSPAPTREPDESELKNLISEEIKDQLIATLGSKITVVDVKFGPVDSEQFTELYVEMNCISDNNNICPSPQVVIAVFDACKAKKKKVVENVPFSTQIMTITIYDPGHTTHIVEVNWSDVIAYMNDDVPAEVFGKLIRYIQ